MKGILKKSEQGNWVVQHNLIDPYSQLPNTLILLLNDDTSSLIEGKEVEFEIVGDFFYYAKLLKK